APVEVELPVLTGAMDDDGRPCMEVRSFPLLEPHLVLRFVHDVAKLRTPVERPPLTTDDTILVGIYADEAQYGLSNADKVFGIFLNLPLFRPRSIRMSRWCISAIRSDFLAGCQTIYPALAQIVKSMSLAMLSQDSDGGALTTDGANFMVTELRGDLALHKFMWGFAKRGWSAHSSCFFCGAQAVGDSCTFDEIGPAASWIPTRFTHTQTWVEQTMSADML
ncbi:unnamed protein product, partial [Effrenium voratum]